MNYDLSTYRAQTAYKKEFLKAIKSTKEDFEKLPETEQLSKVKDWFETNKKRIRMPKEVKTVTKNFEIDYYITKLIKTADSEVYPDAMETLKELVNLKEERKNLEELKNRIENLNEDYENRETEYNKKLRDTIDIINNIS